MQVAHVRRHDPGEIDQARAALRALEGGMRRVETEAESGFAAQTYCVLGIADDVTEPASAEVPRVRRQVLEQEIDAGGVQLAERAQQPRRRGVDVIGVRL